MASGRRREQKYEEADYETEEVRKVMSYEL
jgi:hypothetical protein